MNWKKVAVAGILLPCGFSCMAQASEPWNPIRLSANSNRWNATDLNGQTVHGNVYVFLNGPKDVVKVRWYIDKLPAQKPKTVDVDAPYDLMGTGADGAAMPGDTRSLSDGPHFVVAQVKQSNGDVVPHRADFTVMNAMPAPSFAKGIMSQGAPLAGHDYIDYVMGGTDIKWDQLETSDQVFNGAAWSKIDALLANPRIKGLRLRIYAGRYAPAFVKKLGGPPVSSVDPLIDCSVSGGIAVLNPSQPPTTGCVPYFWLSGFMTQYRELMVEVERRYGLNPKFLEIVDSACSTIYAEPFYRAHADAASNARLYNAGLTPEADEECQKQAMLVHQSVLPRQSVSLAINPWDVVLEPGSNPDNMVKDWPKTKAFADEWRGIMGSRLVLQNNSWGESDACLGRLPEYNVYCYLEALKYPKGYQSEQWALLDDTPPDGEPITPLEGWYLILENAIQAGMCFVESTDNNYKLADPVLNAEYDRRLEENCP